MNKLILADYFIIGAVLLFFSCHVITNFMVNKYQSVAEKIGMAKDLAYTFEANPIAKFMFKVTSLKYIYTYIIMPGLIGGVYYTQRKKKDINPDGVTAFALTALLFGLFNFLNDFTVLLGYLSSV